MILLNENNHLENNNDIVPIYKPTAFTRQLSTKSILRKTSSNANTFPLQPINDNNANNRSQLYRTTSISRHSSSKSNASDVFEKYDLFSQLTCEQLEEFAKACEELQQKEPSTSGSVTPRISLLRSLSQQASAAASASANYPPYKMSQFLMSSMIDPQQQLNQQVPYPYCGNQENNSVGCPSATGHDRTTLTANATAALMEFMDDERNQLDMENYYGGVGVGAGGPTLGEINTNVHSSGNSVSSSHAPEVIDPLADQVGYILNEEQIVPEYLGSWASSISAPVFTTAANQLPIPTMAPFLPNSNRTSVIPASSAPHFGGYALPVRNSLVQQPLTFDVPAMNKPIVSKSHADTRAQQNIPAASASGIRGVKIERVEAASLMTITPPPQSQRSNSKRALYENEDDTNESDATDQSSSAAKREWWEYNVNHRGQRLDSVISRMRAKPRSNDPHVLPIKEDPVFDADVADSSKQVLGFNVRHGGKARIGNGNDLTPRPERLRSMKNLIEGLDAKMESLAVARDDTDKERTRKRREKNRLASRVCRLKRKAQHEANKVLLYGLETEHRELLSALDKIKEDFRAKINGNSSSSLSVEAAIGNVKQTVLLTDCDLRPQAFVNNIINEGKRSITTAKQQQQQQQKNVQLMGVGSSTISSRRQAKRLSAQ